VTHTKTIFLSLMLALSLSLNAKALKDTSPACTVVMGALTMAVALTTAGAGVIFGMGWMENQYFYQRFNNSELKVVGYDVNNTYKDCPHFTANVMGQYQVFSNDTFRTETDIAAVYCRDSAAAALLAAQKDYPSGSIWPMWYYMKNTTIWTWDIPFGRVYQGLSYVSFAVGPIVMVGGLITVAKMERARGQAQLIELSLAAQGGEQQQLL